MESPRKVLEGIQKSKVLMDQTLTKLELKTKDSQGYAVFVSEVEEIIKEISAFIKQCHAFQARVLSVKADEVCILINKNCGMDINPFPHNC